MGRKDIKQKMNQTQTAMQIFEYQGNEVRTIQHGDEVWWVLRDVCRVLSLSNPAKVAQRLDEDEKDITLSYTPGGYQEITIVNEPGLYSVILRSDKPEAKTFKRWVTHEVLPSIRKTGTYSVGQELTDEEKMAHGLIAANAILQRQLEKKAMKDIPMIEFINGYQTLTAAMDEYNTYGYMTAETLSSLASSGMIQYLEATANGLSINTDALLQNAEAAKVSAINALQNSVAQQLVALAAGDVAIAAPGAGDAIVAAGEMAAASAAGFKTASAAAAETTIFLEGVRDAQAGNAVDPDAYRDRADQLIANAQAVANSIAKIDIASAGYQKAMAGNAKSTGSAKSAADEYVESLKKEKEALQDVKNELDDQKDAYDSVIRAVQKALDKEIEALEKQKDALSDPDIEGSYGNRINFIQMEIDALNDLRAAKEREIAVEKAKAELERLKDQKTLRVYMEGEGFVWRTDESAIRDAQEALDKAELDKQISDLEDAKEKLEDMLEQEEEALDKNIEKLQEYKDKWGEIADAYQDEQDRLMAAQVLGQNWEAEILNGRIETLTSFRDKYISIMAEIAAKVEEIEALERRIKEAQNSIGSSSGNSGGGGSGATNASLPRYRVVNTRYGTVSRSGFTTQSAAQEYIKTLGASQGFFRIEKYANGTMFSPTTLAYVDDGIGRNAGSELIVRAPKHGRLTSLELGSGVIPAQATKNLIAMAKSPQTMLQEQFKNLFNNQMLAANSVGTNKIFEFKFGDIIMHGVNDTMSFAKILTREFPAILKQELGR